MNVASRIRKRFWFVGFVVLLAVLTGCTSSPASVTVRWRTDAEGDVVGFLVYRSTSLDGPWEQVTVAPIPARGDAISGSEYVFTDERPDGARYYVVEEVLVDGTRRRYPPVAATSFPSLLDVPSDVVLVSAALVFGGAVWWLVRTILASRGGSGRF